MPIPVYTPPTKDIRLPGPEGVVLTVRGLSFEDITTLVREHLPDITFAVEKYRDSRADVYTRASMDEFLMSTLNAFPGLVAVIIAQAAGSPDDADAIATYPAGAQMAALIAVSELTLDDMGALTDPSPALADLVRRAMGAVTQRTISSDVTSGLPAAPSAD